MKQYRDVNIEEPKVGDLIQVHGEGPVRTVKEFFEDLCGEGCWEAHDEECEERSNPGYHIAEIRKGELGTLDKIREELEEAIDAAQQACKIMVAVELSDLIGAVEAYAAKELNLTLEDLIKMQKITKRAFESGRRK